MEHSPRAQELLTALCAALPALRPLEEGDLPQVLTLYQRNTFYNSVALEAPPTLKSCQEDLAALPPGRELRHKLFLGLFQGAVLAAVLDLVEGYPDEGSLYIGLLELAVEFHRQGLGTRLVRALKTAAGEAGFSALRLGCYDRNTPGMAFWNAMGFEKEGAVLREGRVLHKMFLPL
mgnify:CR=1 FL=1